MDIALDRFEILLGRLEDARLNDEGVHRHFSSLEERSASHDVLMSLRAEMAQIRDEGTLEEILVASPHDSRTRQGTRLD
jgi:hypothetical protein